jgi:LPS O-antigen subunit length determinant protein (WzzB/FepE family)
MSETRKNDASNYTNDEIDLIDLIGALWEGKWIIIGVTAIVSLLGALYVFAQPRFITASIPVKIEVHDSDFAHINKELTKYELPAVGSLQVGKAVENELAQLDLPTALSIVKVSINDDQRVATLVVKGDEVSQAEIDRIAEQLASVERQVQENIKESAELSIEEILQQAQFQQELIEIEIQNLTELQRLENAVRVSFLEDQLEIARVIGQEYSIFQNRDGILGSGSSLFDLPYYHFGSIAISQELVNLKSKEIDPEAYPEIARHSLKLASLQKTTDRLVNKIRTELDELKDGAVLVFSSADIVKSRDGVSLRLLILAVLAGGFLSLVVLVMWNSLRAYWRRQANS